ncbi:MAG: hypothetical protein ACRDRH_17355 [Pseudonocardia sp.]
MLISDVGDVLVTTRPGAHHRALAALTDRPVADVAAVVEAAGIVAGFERGDLDGAAFAALLREVLAAPHLTDADLQAAWNAVLGTPVPPLVAAAAVLAARGQLAIASNTNPWHWPVARRRLAGAGLDVTSVPTVLSYRIGQAKPEAGYFTILLGHIAHLPSAVFVDDKHVNIDAARAHRLNGWIHTDVAASVARIQVLAGTGRH